MKGGEWSRKKKVAVAGAILGADQLLRKINSMINSREIFEAQESYNVRDGPNKDDNSLGIMPKGCRFKVIKMKNVKPKGAQAVNVRIINPDGTQQMTGWVRFEPDE